MKQKLARLDVHRLPTCPTKGRLVVGGIAFPCVLGRSGIRVAKREGDGATPRGRLPLRALFQRLDRAPRLPCLLPTRRIRPDLAWCDDPADRRYNRLMPRPKGEVEERLWRADRLYDVIVPLGWNDGPVVKGRGSSIFWHLTRPNRSPTAGCVAVEPAVFRKVLPRLAKKAVMRVR